MFVLTYWLRENSWSEIANLFELRCESKATDAIVLQNLLLVPRGSQENDASSFFKSSKFK